MKLDITRATVSRGRAKLTRLSSTTTTGVVTWQDTKQTKEANRLQRLLLFRSSLYSIAVRELQELQATGHLSISTC